MRLAHLTVCIILLAVATSAAKPALHLKCSLARPTEYRFHSTAHNLEFVRSPHNGAFSLISKGDFLQADFGDGQTLRIRDPSASFLITAIQFH